MRRILSVTCLLVLAWWFHPASAGVQLCGFADNIADTLIVTGIDDPEGGPFMMVTGWAQIVPTAYTLLGSGTFIRTPGDPNTFSGGLIVVNNSAAFANNPICAVSPVIQQPNPLLKIFIGSADLRCVAGGAGPFNVTITFSLTPCDDEGPFVSTSGELYRSGVPAAGGAPVE